MRAAEHGCQGSMECARGGDTMRYTAARPPILVSGSPCRLEPEPAHKTGSWGEGIHVVCLRTGCSMRNLAVTGNGARNS